MAALFSCKGNMMALCGQIRAQAGHPGLQWSGLQTATLP